MKAVIGGSNSKIGDIGSMISGLIGGKSGDIGGMLGGLLGGNAGGAPDIKSLLSKVTNFGKAEQSLPEIPDTTTSQTSDTTTPAVTSTPTETAQPQQSVLPQQQIAQPTQSAIDSQSLNGILKALATIATNTDQLNTIVTILKSKSSIDANDFAKAQTQNTASSQVGEVTRSINAKSKFGRGYKDTNNVGNIIDRSYDNRFNMALDEAQSKSFNTIIDKMNAIASE